MNPNVKYAMAALRKFLRPDDTVYTQLKHVSPSGMTRHVGVLVGHGRRILDLTRNVAHVCDERYDRETGGIVVQGCGYDVGYDLVHKLRRALWPGRKGTATLKQAWV